MHKDKPPGLFDFGARSISHAVGLGLASGFLLSVVVHVGLLIWKAESGQSTRRGTVEEAQRLMSSHRKPSTEVTPVPPPAVNY